MVAEEADFQMIPSFSCSDVLPASSLELQNGLLPTTIATTMRSL